MVGVFVGLLVADVLTGDITPGRPVLGAAKGLSGALGAAFPLVSLTDARPFVTVCGTAVGGIVESVGGREAVMRTS